MIHSTTFDLPFVRGKARPRWSGGRAYTPRQTADDMAAVREAWDATGAGRAPRGVEVAVSIVTTRPLPTSRPKSCEREGDTVKPDADNIAKLILDGLNGAAWDDDVQVTQLSVTKLQRFRGARAHTTVNVRWTA